MNEIRTTRQVLEAIVAEVHENGWKDIKCNDELQARLRARFYHARRMKRAVGFNGWDDINIITTEDGVRFELNSLTTAIQGDAHGQGPKAA